MPIYEYECQSCGHELEKIQRMSDEPLSDCPSCEKPALKRLVSAAGFRLKGGGWYETDFKKGGKRNLHGADGSKDKSKKPEKATEVKKTESKAASANSDTA